MSAEERREYMRQWRAKNRDAVNAYKRNYIATHPRQREKRNEQSKQWQRDHPEYVRQYQYKRRMAKAKEFFEKENKV